MWGLVLQKTKETKISLSSPLPQSRRGWPSVALSLLNCTISSQNWVLMSPSGKVWGEKSSPFPTLGTSEETGLIGVAASALQTLARRCLEALESWWQTLTKCMEVSSGKWLLSLSQINVYCDSRPCFNTKIFFFTITCPKIIIGYK